MPQMTGMLQRPAVPGQSSEFGCDNSSDNAEALCLINIDTPTLQNQTASQGSASLLQQVAFLHMHLALAGMCVNITIL